MNSPKDFRLLLDENIRGRAIPIKGRDKALIDSFPNPKKAIIQAVRVVPMFAPMITPIDCAKLSNPAFTKLTTITVVADED